MIYYIFSFTSQVFWVKTQLTIKIRIKILLLYCFSFQGFFNVKADLLKYQFWKNVTLEKMNSDGLNTFTTYFSSLLGVIAIVFSNHAQKWRQIYVKVFNPTEFHWYFSNQPIFLSSLMSLLNIFFGVFIVHGILTLSSKRRKNFDDAKRWSNAALSQSIAEK